MVLSKTTLCTFISFLVVDSQHNYLCDYDKWTFNNIGTWSMNPNECILQQTDAYAKGAVTWLDNYNNIGSLQWTNYSVEVSLSITSESSLNNNGYAGIIFRAQNISNNINGGEFYIVYMVIENQKPLVISKVMDNHYTQEASVSSNVVGGAIRSNQHYTLKIIVNGSNFAAFFNGHQYTLNWTDDNNVYNKGSVGLRTWKASAMFTSFRITWPGATAFVTTDIATSGPTSVPTYTMTSKPSSNSQNISQTDLFSTKQISQPISSKNSNHIQSFQWIIVAIVVSVVVFVGIGVFAGYWLYRRTKYNTEVKNINKCAEQVFIDGNNSK